MGLSLPHCVAPQGLLVPAAVTAQMRGGEGQTWTDSGGREREKGEMAVTILDLTCGEGDADTNHGLVLGNHWILVYWLGLAQAVGSTRVQSKGPAEAGGASVLPRLLSIFW